MKRIILRSIVSIGFMALMAFTIAPASVSAQQAAPKKLEGVWDSRVTLTNCQSGAVLAMFRAFEMFIHGGSLTDTNAAPNAATSRGPGFGRWQHLDGQNYSAAMQFFRFNPDGSFAGVQKINRAIVLANDGNSYTSTVTFESDDPSGNVLMSGCGTETATRLQ